jgi:glycosyltransferase involved in cell wall biosynthesis
MTVSILLPYKENFSPNYAGAVSLFVKDTTNHSIYKNNTYVFGSMIYKKTLLKNYINLNLEKKFYQSSSKQYVESFVEYEKKRNSKIIEVHNRPNYIKFIKKNYKNKLVLYFHNDPLTMNGSKNIQDRLYLLNNLDKIIFNSNWSKDRFFVNLPNKQLLSQKTSVCYQSAPRTNVNFKKKEKIISFIGKLNSAKGYDLFGNAITKILDKYENWKAIVIGDEPREKLIFKHKNLKVAGFKNNDYILKFLKKVSISVVCSRWNEPFGRTSLEAASRGSAVIISKRGGLPETAEDAIILKSLTSNDLYSTIEKLILNKKKLLFLQKKNYKNFKFNHKFITNIIDKIREQLSPEINFTKFNIRKNSILKILHLTNFNERFNGRLHYNTGRRLNNGFIRLGHNVLSISDRDIVSKNKKITDPKGNKALQTSVIDSFNNFQPDAIVLGHADGLSLDTLDYLKSKKKDLKISQWFLDPLSKYGPDHQKNKKRILDKNKLMDATFLTTDPNALSIDIQNSHFMPNPCDHSFETLKNYENNCSYDVFFAMSHGVHRGDLKKGKYDDREFYINRLLKKNREIKFDIYGMNNVQPIWGDDFIKRISRSSMGLNLSRGKPIKYYSSDRIAQLLGNGLLTFVHEDIYFRDFLSSKEIIFYKDINDLSYKLNKYKRDHKERKKIARQGKIKYFRYFNSTIVADYILSNTMGYKSKNKFIWNR